MARLLNVLVIALALATGALAQGPVPPAAAGSAGSSGGGGGGAAPVAPAGPTGPKKALLGAALRDLTGVLVSRPAGGAPSAGKLSGVVGTLLSLVLDNNFNGLISQPQGIFDFGNSGAASIVWPQGNLRQVKNFANLLLNATTTGDLAGIAPAVGGALDALCTPERFVPQQLIAAGCKGPEVELRMAPAECLVMPSTGELKCRPAYLLLETRPAECSLPRMSPPTWEGRSCAAFSEVGPKIDYAVGYQPFNATLPSPQPIAQALLAPLRGAGSRLLEKVGRKIGGAVAGGAFGGGGGSSTSTTAAVGGQQG